MDIQISDSPIIHINMDLLETTGSPVSTSCSTGSQVMEAPTTVADVQTTASPG